MNTLMDGKIVNYFLYQKLIFQRRNFIFCGFYLVPIPIASMSCVAESNNIFSCSKYNHRLVTNINWFIIPFRTIFLMARSIIFGA